MSRFLVAASLLATAGCRTARRGAPETGPDRLTASAPLPGTEASAAATAVEQTAIAAWDQPASPTRRLPARTQVYRELVPIEAVFGEVGLGGVPQSVGDVEIVNRRPTSTAPLPGGQAAGAESAAGTTASQAPTSAIPTFAQYVRWLEGSGLHYSIPGETPATPGGAATPETAAAGTTTPDPAQDQAAAITPGQPYTVRKGDSLWLIARRAYGDATQWRKIYDANAQQLPSAADLRPGIVLQIP